MYFYPFFVYVSFVLSSGPSGRIIEKTTAEPTSVSGPTEKYFMKIIFFLIFTEVPGTAMFSTHFVHHPPPPQPGILLSTSGTSPDICPGKNYELKIADT